MIDLVRDRRSFQWACGCVRQAPWAYAVLFGTWTGMVLVPLVFALWLAALELPSTAQTLWVLNAVWLPFTSAVIVLQSYGIWPLLAGVVLFVGRLVWHPLPRPQQPFWVAFGVYLVLVFVTAVGLDFLDWVLAGAGDFATGAD